MISPPLDCQLCPRLAASRDKNNQTHPSFYNAPVYAFGDEDPWLLIIGLAPGFMGANQTGRPFTGDYAGDLLYDTLLKFKLATGTYEARPDDSLQLKGCRITNAVKCWPPENKPTGTEINTCNGFLKKEIASYKSLKAILCLGKISHDATLKAFDQKLSAFKFAHNASHQLTDKITLYDSYHCSRYNTNTGRLTTEMFEDVFANIEKR